MINKGIMLFLLMSLLCCREAVEAQPDIVCPRAKSVDMSTRLHISDPYKTAFTEISGLGFSPKLKGESGKPLVHLMNDGGGGRRFGIYDSGTGLRVISLRLPRSLGWNIDFESMSVGSCGIDEEESTCIYIFDVGDNTARHAGGDKTGIHAFNRTAYPIYKIKEPNPDDFIDNAILPESYVTTLHFNYFHPSSPTRYSDCEAAFLDNVGWGANGAIGDLYILTKWSSRSTKTRLFKIPAVVWRQAKIDPNFVYSPRAVGDYSNGVESNAISGHRWTRGEMTRDGTLIVLGDYYDQYLYLRCPGMSVAQAIAIGGTRHCNTWPIAYWDSQFETIAWSPDGKFTLEISECTSSYCRTNDPMVPMVFTEMDYTYDATTAYCRTVPTAAPTKSPSTSPSISTMPSVSSAPSPAPTPCQSVLESTEMLYKDKEPRFLCSPNGMFRFGFLDSSDLVLWRRGNGGNNTEIWSAGTCCSPNEVFLHMQGTDANLVVYEKSNGSYTVRWESETANSDYSGAELSLENDGQARIRFNGVEIWSTGNGLVPQPTPAPTPKPTTQTTAPTPKPSLAEAAPAPIPRPSCSRYGDKTSCKEVGCKWKGGVCIVKKQMN